MSPYSKSTCVPCNCSVIGSEMPCNPIGGECTCRTGFTGPSCNQCDSGYMGDMCQKCDCNESGTMPGGQCELNCQCKVGLIFFILFFFYNI